MSQKSIQLIKLTPNRKKILTYFLSASKNKNTAFRQTRTYIHDQTNMPMTTLENNLKGLLELGLLIRHERREYVEEIDRGRPSYFFQLAERVKNVITKDGEFYCEIEN